MCEQCDKIKRGINMSNQPENKTWRYVMGIIAEDKLIHLERIMLNAELTEIEKQILVFLDRFGWCKISYIADNLFLSRGKVQRGLDNLEELDFVICNSSRRPKVYSINRG